MIAVAASPVVQSPSFQIKLRENGILEINFSSYDFSLILFIFVASQDVCINVLRNGTCT